MKIIENIQQSIGSFFLKKEVASLKRQIQVCNLQQAICVGVLFYASDEKVFRVAKNYVRMLREEGIKTVQALGYFHEKETPQFVTPERDFDYFNKKDLNWFMKPDSASIHKFANQKFDILVDLSIEEVFPVEFVLATSKAKFKVGKGGGKNSHFYDLMINIEEGQGLNFLVKNINHYLNMINKTEADVA